MIRTETHSLFGDWRASAHGSARRAHLFTPGRQTACGARVAYRTTAAVRRRPLNDLCYDCLAYGASGRAEPTESELRALWGDR